MTGAWCHGGWQRAAPWRTLGRMAVRFDYDIDLDQLIPPMGGMRYVAKVAILVRRDAAGTTTRLLSPVGEYYGHDEGEARAKARSAIEAWIASQPLA